MAMSCAVCRDRETSHVVVHPSRPERAGIPVCLTCYTLKYRQLLNYEALDREPIYSEYYITAGKDNTRYPDEPEDLDELQEPAPAVPQDLKPTAYEAPAEAWVEEEEPIAKPQEVISRKKDPKHDDFWSDYLIWYNVELLGDEL